MKIQSSKRRHANIKVRLIPINPANQYKKNASIYFAVMVSNHHHQSFIPSICATMWILVLHSPILKDKFFVTIQPKRSLLTTVQVLNFAYPSTLCLQHFCSSYMVVYGLLRHDQTFHKKEGKKERNMPKPYQMAFLRCIARFNISLKIT